MPTEFDWQSAAPEDHGLRGSVLERMRQGLEKRGTKSLLVIRNDRIVLEWYADGHGPRKTHYTASLAKAIVGGTSLMFALEDGLIGVDDPAWKYVPSWETDPRKSKITIRHLATHSSGVENAELSDEDLAQALAEGTTLTDHHMSLPGWKGAFWRQEPDPFTLSRDAAPIIFEPGTQYDYSNPGIAMLTYAVTSALSGTRHPDVRSLLKARMMDPMDVPDDAWSIGYGKTFQVDALPLCGSWGGGAYTARAIASVGRVMLRKGDWEGRQLVSPETVDLVLAPAGTPLPPRPPGNPQPGSGLSWWLNADGVWPAVPRDAFGGAGAGNQILLVVPSLDLIIVRNGATIGDESRGEGFWGGVEKYLFNPIIKAISAG